MKGNIKRIMLFLLLFLFGITSVKAVTKNIGVEDISVKDKSGTITVVDPVFVSNEVTSNITFNQKDDFVTLDLTLKNNESEKYKISSITDNNTNENLKTEYSFSEDYMNTGDTSKVTIKLTYKKQLLNVDQISLSDLTIKIALVNEDGDSEDIIINPTTGDNILHYLVLLIIAMTGLILIAMKKKIFRVKVGSLLIVFAIIMIPFAAIAKEQYEINIKFDDIVVKGEFETYNISVDPGNGDPVDVRAITYGEKLGNLPTVTKNGYNFVKWTDAEGNEVTKDTVITGPIEVIANYEVITYHITYNLDSGSATNPETYTIESQSITLNNPNKEGYTFTGWTGTGIDTQTTNVTIAHGSTGDRTYQANYSANDNTSYKVIHKFAKLNGEYDTEEVIEHGTTGTTVPAPRKTRTGFVTPTVQNVYIAADGKAEITYTYERELYSFSITDRTYVDESVSTPNNSYPYETPITVKALEREGYEFAWSDGDTNYERTFDLTSTTSLTPIYTAKTNTPYTVEHYKMKFAVDDYELADTQELTGKTDDPITPAVNTYEGFTSPATQSTTIGGDGHTVVKYYYTRNQYTLTVNNPENVVEGDISGPYYYEEQITLTAKTLEGKTFVKWDNNVTDNPITITIGTSNIAIGPIYSSNEFTVTFDTDGGSTVPSQTVEENEKATRPTDDPTKSGYKFIDWYEDDQFNTLFDFDTLITEDTTIYAKFVEDLFPVVFKHEGACIFKGKDEAMEGDECEFADGVNKYIDTGISLYSSDNINQDYEIGFTIVSYDASEQEESQATLMNTKLEGDKYPGLVFRRSEINAGQFDLSSKETMNFNKRIYVNREGVEEVKIFRIYNSELDAYEIFYSINDGEKVKVNDLSQYNPVFNLNVWFGAAPKNIDGSEAQRYLKGTLSNMYIKLGTYRQEKTRNEVTFDTDGGSEIEKQIVIIGKTAKRPAYIPAKDGYNFVDWYTDDTLQTPFDFDTPITEDTTVYAKYEEETFPYVFNHTGACEFNGSGVAMSGDNCAFANGNNTYIDTRVNLYNAANHDKDYEIGFTIVSYTLDGQDRQATFMNTKLEGNSNPGLVFRRKNNASDFDLSSRKTSGANETVNFAFGSVSQVKIYRIYNSEADVQEIFYKINDGEKIKINDLSQFNPIFDLSVWFGATPTNVSATAAQRFLTGTLKDMYIKVGNYHE